MIDIDGRLRNMEFTSINIDLDDIELEAVKKVFYDAGYRSDPMMAAVNEEITPQAVTAAYYKYRTMRYLLEHPGADPAKAYKYARVAWSRKRKRRPLMEVQG